VDAVPHLREEPRHLRPEFVEAAAAHAVAFTFGNEVGDLPVLAPVDENRELSRAESAAEDGSLIRIFREAKPEHVHQR